MKIFEIDDFDYWTDNLLATNENEFVFSPLFVFLIYWAYCENKLSKTLIEESNFISYLLNLEKNIGSFSHFVMNYLDGKICDSYFDESVRQFVSDYYEYTGYSKDLVKVYNKNLWALPHSLSSADKLNKAINNSLANYMMNKKREPDLIDFTKHNTIG
jgi:hypothetical protein